MPPIKRATTESASGQPTKALPEFTRMPEELLRRMAANLPPSQRDEMAIPSYLHRNPAMRWMAWRRVELLADRLIHVSSGRQPTTIVDFGCGTGVLVELASGLAERVFAVDHVLDAVRMLVSERQLLNVELLEPAEAEMRIAPASVDSVLAGEVLEHVEHDLDRTLNQFHTWLKRDGRLLVTLPTESLLYRTGRWLAGFRGDYHHHHAASVHRRVLSSGFQALNVRRIPAGGPLSIYWLVEYAPAPTR